MVEARNIVLVSFPFAAGVALAQFCSFPLFHISLAASAVLLTLALAGRLNGRGWHGLLFFAIGALCGSVGLQTGPDLTDAGNGLAGLCARALGRTDAVIRAMPFRHEGTNSLLRALLTGQRDGLPRETVRAFRAAGASHILALSGLHLGIIYLIVSKLLAPLGNGRITSVIRSAAVVLVSAFYTFMTGASPSTVRALLFITINEIMRHFPGRQKSPLAVWCSALMIQLTFCPWAIRSVGFQLSYLAMLGIFVLFPPLDAFYPKSGRRGGFMKWIWSSMALSIACQVFTAPLVWLRFGTFPKYFLLTNLLALPLTTALMFSSVALLLLGFAGIYPAPLVFLTDILAEYLQKCLEIIAALN